MAENKTTPSHPNAAQISTASLDARQEHGLQTALVPTKCGARVLTPTRARCKEAPTVHILDNSESSASPRSASWALPCSPPHASCEPNSTMSGRQPEPQAASTTSLPNSWERKTVYQIVPCCGDTRHLMGQLEFKTPRLGAPEGTG